MSTKKRNQIKRKRKSKEKNMDASKVTISRNLSHPEPLTVEMRDTLRRKKIIDMIRELPDGTPISSAMFAERIGTSRNHAGKLIVKMVDEGIVGRSPSTIGDKRVFVHWVIKNPYENVTIPEESEETQEPEADEDTNARRIQETPGLVRSIETSQGPPPGMNNYEIGEWRKRRILEIIRSTPSGQPIQSEYFTKQLGINTPSNLVGLLNKMVYAGQIGRERSAPFRNAPYIYWIGPGKPKQFSNPDPKVEEKPRFAPIKGIDDVGSSQMPVPMPALDIEPQGATMVTPKDIDWVLRRAKNFAWRENSDSLREFIEDLKLIDPTV